MSKADIADKEFGVGEGMYETTSAGSVSAVPMSVGGMQKRNPDGTAVSALDQDTNIFGNGKKTKKNKKKA